MSLEKLNDDFNRYLKFPDNRTETGKVLLKSIVESINELYNRPRDHGVFEYLTPPEVIVLPELPEEAFMTLQDFMENYRIEIKGKKKPIASDSSLSTSLRTDPELFNYCGQRGETGVRWFIKPLHYIHYMSRAKNNPKLRNKCKEWLLQNARHTKGKDDQCILKQDLFDSSGKGESIKG